MGDYRRLATLRFGAAAITLALLAVACAQEQNEGLAVSNAGETTIAAPATESSAVAEATDEAADAAEKAETPVPAADDGTALASVSDHHVLDLNYDIPERLVVDLEPGELRNLVIDVHGPTDDVAAELNRIGIFPESFPTIPGSDIQEVAARLSLDRDPATYSSEVRFYINVPVDDVIAFYEAGLSEPDYVRTGTAERVEDDLTIYTVEYATPTSDAAYQRGLEMDFVTGDFSGTVVLVDMADALTPGQSVLAIDQIAALGAWETNTPLPDGGVPRSSQLRTSLPLLSFGPGYQNLSVTRSQTYPGTTGVDLAESVLSLVDGSDYGIKTFDGEPPPDEKLSEAIANGDNFVLYSLNHPSRESTMSMTLWGLDAEREGDPYVEFDGGAIDLYEAP